MSMQAELAFARAILNEEAQAVAGLSTRLGAEFCQAVDLIVKCADQGGTVLVSGLGKSGLIGQKISATFASLGIPSHFVHPSEAAHGDLGRFRAADIAVCLSFSGETDEVVDLATMLKPDNIPIISITGGVAGDENDKSVSSLCRLATVALTLGIESEAGGSAAPTISTTATLAMGDALALASARRRNFTDEDFARRHPGGSLGALLRPVTEIMRFATGKNLPLMEQTLSVAEALRLADSAGRRPGALLVVDDAGMLVGIFTDGDLRRLVLKDVAGLSATIATVMTKTPRTLLKSSLVRDAVRMVREFRQDEIPVVDDGGRPVGLLDVQDLIALRLIKD